VVLDLRDRQDQEDSQVDQAHRATQGCEVLQEALDYLEVLDLGASQVLVVRKVTQELLVVQDQVEE